jgi:hypothetical protein
MASRIFGFILLTGGGTGALDAIDGDLLSDKDIAIGVVDGVTRTYYLDADSGASESSPATIAPNTNAGDKRWILSDAGDDFSLSDYADQRALELEWMKLNFQAISWAQFAIFESFDDSTKRASPDPSTYDARVYANKLDNGEDTTASRSFGFVSKTYTGITTLITGSSTSVGENFLTDTSKSWYTDECKNLTLTDAVSSTFTVTENDGNTLTVVGTPAAGSYTLKTANPAYAVAFCSYSDSTAGGGNGYVKLEVSFDGGSNYQTFLDTEASVNLLEGTVAIANPGTSYIARVTLKNDGSGNGPYVHKFLVCTDPSPWRW